MRIRLLFSSFLFLSFLSGCSERGTPGPIIPSGKQDKIVFVNYWAEWCKPCRDEIPELNAFQKQHAEEVVLYGVNFDGARGAELARQEEVLGIEFETLGEDPGPGLGWPVPEGLPYTMVTDSANSRLLQLPGEQNLETLRKALADFRQVPGGER